MTGGARRPSRAVALVSLVLALTACGGQDPPETGPTPRPGASASVAEVAQQCGAVVRRVVDATQAYVDGYGAQVSGDAPAPSPTPAGGATASPSGTPTPDVTATLEAAQADLAALGCPPATVTGLLDSGLAGVTASGPLATAVRDQLVASLTGRVGQQVEERTLRPGESLAAVLPTLKAGSTVVLAPGEHVLDETVVLLQGVTLRGASAATTTVTSTASDAGLLVLTDGRVELAGLTLRHRGESAASVVVGGPSSSLVVRDAVVSGARSSGEGGEATGGSGVLMSARDDEAGERGTTLEVTRTTFRGNTAGGVLLTGGHRASIVASRFADNGQCGVCFLGASGGALRDSELRGGGVGVVVAGSAAPLLSGLRVDDVEIGVQVSGSATPVVRGAAVREASRAAVLFTDRSRGRVDGVSCPATPFGIVVSPGALPYVGTNTCATVPGR